MCGLFGGMTSTLVPKEIEVIEKLGIVSQFRGLDSTGMCVASRPDSKNFRDYDIFRTLGPSGNLIYGKEYMSFDARGSSAIIGHCRATTVGEINIENAHPIHHGNIIGTHNGTLGSFPVENGRSDSSQFFEVLDAYDGNFTQVYRDILGIGDAFAFVWFDIYNDTFNMVRNEQRTLFTHCSSETPSKGSLLVYASEHAMIDFVRKHMKRGSTPAIKIVEPHVLHTWDIGDPSSLRMSKLNVSTSYTFKPASPGKISEVRVPSTKSTTETSSLFHRVPDDSSSKGQLIPFEKPEEEEAKPIQKESNDNVKRREENKELFTQFQIPSKCSQTGHVLFIPQKMLGLDSEYDIDISSLPSIYTEHGQNYYLRYVGYGGRLMPVSTASKKLRKGSAFSTEKARLIDYNALWLAPQTYILIDEWDTEFVQAYMRRTTDKDICIGGLVYVHSKAIEPGEGETEHE